MAEPARPRYDLVIAGRDVIDPARGFRGPAEIAVSNGRIAAIAPDRRLLRDICPPQTAQAAE